MPRTGGRNLVRITFPLCCRPSKEDVAGGGDLRPDTTGRCPRRLAPRACQHQLVIIQPARRERLYRGLSLPLPPFGSPYGQDLTGVEAQEHTDRP